jgi:hypothetical protein
MTFFTGYWLTRGRPYCLARWPSSSFSRWLVEHEPGTPPRHVEVTIAGDAMRPARSYWGTDRGARPGRRLFEPKLSRLENR